MSTADAFCVTKGRGCQEQVAKSKQTETALWPAILTVDGAGGKERRP